MIECLQRQTYQGWKAFLVDDHSTDNTVPIIQSFSVQDSRINLVIRDRPPKGAQTCRNIGFELSQGAEYVVFFDADDLVAPYCLEQRIRFMEMRPDLDFGVFLSKKFINNPDELRDVTLFGFRYAGLSDLQRLLRRTHPFVIWSNIYRRSALIRAGIVWDERILSLQDSDFNMQSFKKQLNYDYDDDCRIDYYYRASGLVSHTYRKIGTSDHKESHLILLDKFYHSLSEKQKKECRFELDDYVLYFIEMFYKDSVFVSRILRLLWTKNRLWFRFRVRIYCLLKRMNRCGKKVLFPKLNSYRKIYDVEYRQYQKQLLAGKEYPDK